MKKNTITCEMQDGSIYGPHRVIFADKVHAEKTFRANGWEFGGENIRLEGFFAWAASRRAGDHAHSYEAFLEQLVDTAFQSQDADDEDPTPADTSA